MAPGPLALLGSGEFTSAMEELDARLLQGRPPRAVFLPTAAAQEGAARIQYWVDLGNDHFERLGVEVEALRVLDGSDAARPEIAARIVGAGLVYLSGGDPTYLAETLRGSAVGDAIRQAWEAGAAVAGCSAGAMALADHVPRVRDPAHRAVDGLGFVTGIVVVPHFDRIDHWMPGATDLAVASAPEGAWVVGLDEDTALVGGTSQWTVYGRGSVWLMQAGAERRQFTAGQEVATPGVGERT